MRKVSCVLCCSLALLHVFSQARAEEEELEFASVRIGLGASLGSDSLIMADNDWFFLPLSFSNFYIPVIVSDIVTIEPEFGYFRHGRSDFDSESSYDFFRFGLGLFYTPIIGRTAIHAGIRFGILNFSSSSSSGGYSDSDSKTDFYIGPAVGAEYFFSEQFSLGAEIQLNYVQPEVPDSEYPEDNRDEYYISNRSHLFIRFYFGTFRPGEDVDRSGPREPPVKEEAADEKVVPEKPAEVAPPTAPVEAPPPPAEEAKETIEKPEEKPEPPPPVETPPPPPVETAPPPAEEDKEPAKKKATRPKPQKPAENP